MRRFASVLFCAAFFGAAPASAAPPIVLDRLVATVNERKIVRSEVAARARTLALTLTPEERADPKRMDHLLHETLERMIDEALIVKDCAAARIEVTDAEVERAIQEIGKPYDLDRAGVIAAAEKQGVPRGEYEWELRRRLLDHKWMQLRVHPKVIPPSTGTKEEREEAMRALVQAERQRQLAKLRAGAFIELRW